MSKNKGFSDTSANRYSLALYELANESNSLSKIEENSNALLKLISEFCTFPNYKKITTKLNNESVNYVKKLNKLTKKNAKSLEKYLIENLIQKNSSNFKKAYKGF